MAVTREDQNTFIMITGVLIVCLIALIAVITSIWQLIKSPVNQVVDNVSYFVKIQTLDYNFAVETKTVSVTPTPVPTPTPEPPVSDSVQSLANSISDSVVIDYNFNVANKPGTNNDTIDTQKVLGTIISDTDMVSMKDRNESVVQKNVRIKIPRINVDSPIIQGLDSTEPLKQGFWVMPSDKKLSSDEITLLCSRTDLGNTDQRSCWYIDQLSKNDEIIITVEDSTLRYRVVGINTFYAEDPLVYTSSYGEDLIRIVTTDPLYSNKNRLVILAQRSTN
jgi:LPXTG-site transpeptidase (sortase) family protein